MVKLGAIFRMIVRCLAETKRSRTRLLICVFVVANFVAGLYLLWFKLLGAGPSYIGVGNSTRSKSPAMKLVADTPCRHDFQVVEAGSAFVYSAYIDDRPARDVDLRRSETGSVVRVLVYYKRHISAVRTWKCLFWFQGQATPFVSKVIQMTDLNEFSRLPFLVAMVICPLPKTSPLLVLQSLSLTPSTSLTNHSIPFGNVSNFVCVVDLRNSSSSLSNRSLTQTTASGGSLNNKDPTRTIRDPVRPALGRLHPSPSYDVQFTVCTSPIHGDYYNTSNLVNFIEVSRLFGAQKFIFYVDRNTDPSLLRCLESYRDLGVVEFYPFTPPVLEDLHYHGQIVSISDCVYRTMYRTKYLINKDPDEIIVPLKRDNWSDMLEELHSRFNDSESIASYSFRNQFFPLEAPDDPTSGQQTLVRLYDIRALLKTSKDNEIHRHLIRSKVMARPERILIWHVHMILGKNLVRRGDRIHLVSPDDALLYHYRLLEHPKKNLSRDNRMLHFAANITDRVHFAMGLCTDLEE